MFGGLFTIRSKAGASAWLLAAATFLLTAWLQAHVAITALRDDGSTLRAAIGAVQSTGVDDQVLGVVGELFGAADGLSAGTEGIDPAAVGTLRGQVVAGLSQGITPAIEQALVTTVLDARDAAVAQFESDAAAAPLTVRLGALLSATGIVVAPEVAASFGAVDTASIALPVLSADSMASLATQYRWLAPVNAWGLLGAGILGLAGVLLSPRPWRSLAVALGIGGVACLIALPLFELLRGWLLSGGLGAWGALLTPFIDGAVGDIRPLLLPVGIAAIVVAAGVVAWRYLVTRRHASVTEAAAAPGTAAALDTAAAPGTAATTLLPEPSPAA